MTRKFRRAARDANLTRAYEKVIHIGASIGLTADPESAGTVGGEITLHFKDAHGLTGKHNFALTNFHVVRDDKVDHRKLSYQS
jgi:hypothetical protein